MNRLVNVEMRDVIAGIIAAVVFWGIWLIMALIWTNGEPYHDLFTYLVAGAISYGLIEFYLLVTRTRKSYSP